ncbi:MAG: hypothetical protein ACOCP4_05605 [Candidatus Woesearchaeota archaeon]
MIDKCKKCTKTLTLPEILQNENNLCDKCFKKEREKEFKKWSEGKSIQEQIKLIYFYLKTRNGVL